MAKNLVVCCDGTWNLAGQKNPTNVVKIKSAVPDRAADGTVQKVHYEDGVGNRRWEKLRGGAFGWGLSEKVLSAYGFLIKNYEPGDRLYLFGFSRGAYTARSLAGLVRNSGILRREHASRVKEAWELYRAPDRDPRDEAAVRFRTAYSHEPEIRFIGVWDTVGELGVPVPRSRLLKPLAMLVNRRWAFHNTTLSTRVNGAFHALAIDEKRQVFEPTLWNQQPEAVALGQEMKQVWFSGAHVDIGGGYPDTVQSDRTLRWMVANARRYDLEVDLGVRATDAFPGPGPLHDSYTKLFKVFRPLHRPIGRARDKKSGLSDGCEYLAVTAKKRYDDDTGYRPPELVTYLRDFGDTRVDPN